MLRHFTLSQTIHLLTLAWVSVVAAKPKPIIENFSSLVVFGDSYTDYGMKQYRPLANGDYDTPKAVTSTGGRVWPDYVQQYSDINLYDYAISGAVCSSIFSPSPRSGVKDDQVPNFLADKLYVNNDTGKGVLDIPRKETIYAIWIGTNDLGPRAFFTDVEPKGLTIIDYVNCVYEQLDRLYEVGARHFVLMNIAPLDLSPQHALPENGGVNKSRFWQDKQAYNTNITQTSEKMRQYVSLVNTIYKSQTPYYVKVANRYPGSTITLFDVHSLMTEIWLHPRYYLNGTLPLNVTGYILQCSGGECASAESRDSFMWYDELHPSEQTDRILAREFSKVVNGTSKWATYWS